MRMGKIIANNIRRMGWKTRSSLIAVLTLVFSVLIYQGWNQLRNADAAIGMSTWTTLYNNATTYPTSSSVSYTPATGTNRLLIVTIAANRSSVGAITVGTLSFGGQALTLAATSAGDMTSTTPRQHTAIYYLKESAIQTALGGGSSANFSMTLSGGTCNGVIIYATTLTNVDQNAPFTNTPRNYNSGTTSSTTAPAFATALSSSANEKPIVIINAFNGSAATASTLTASTNWTLPSSGTAGNLTLTGSSYAMRAGAFDRAIPTTTTSTTTVCSTLGTSSLRSMSGVTVKAATTTLGNGVAGTNANVAPGAIDQKIDGFSFVTSSTGTTDSVTGLTVTTTGYTAISSIRITDEAGATQYFNTVSNPTSNSITFSGGTPIPVSATAANYKILVTYKSRVAAPTGNTTTTANVTAYTCTNIQATGTDTADTTLTLLNTHAASTWGTCTPGNSQIALNWTYGTAGQSVIIIRYTANTDTTKPTDGTTYTVNSAFGNGGTVIYNGPLTTYTNTGLTNGTNYYYKIFEYDALYYYYNASDVWTAALTPISPDAVAPTVDAGFAATTPVNTLVIPITSFSATDNVGGSGIAGYMVTTSSTKPLASDAAWTSTPPATYTVAAAGTYTLYPWAKDGGGNVSSAYLTPVTVGVDLTKPTVNTFTLTYTQVNSRNIPISAFTATDTGVSGMAGYMVTSTSTPPAAGDPAWSATAPTTFTVATDGSFTLYPWAIDAAGNVSAVFGTPRTVLVDTTGPPVPTLTSPANEATAQPQNTVLSCSTVTDSGVGGVMYQFEITDGATYTRNSGWIAGTSYAPPNLVMGDFYLWKAKAKDALGNESAWTSQNSFAVTAPCVRNDPTMTLLTPLGGVATTISTDSGTSAYNLRVINNDSGDCGSTTFNLSITDTDLYNQFDDSTFNSGLTTSSVTLLPGAETTTTVTARATPGHDSGVEKTTVTAAGDANHAAVTTGFVQTTLNVVTCQPKTPLLIVGPDSGFLNKGGKIVYTITVKNTDTGAGCSPVLYTLSKGTESNTTDFNASQFSTTTLTLGAGELGSATLTVSAKTTAAKNAVNLTPIHLAAAGHTSPPDVTVRSTVNNPMLHNSVNVNSTKWSVSGGWGIPNGRYGEIECATCHVGGGGDTLNVKRINEKIFTPYTSAHNHFPGEGKTIAYRRYIGTKATDPVLGWDAGATPRSNPNPTKICEACHTYDATGANGVKAHPYSTGATLGNHFNTDGKDCTRCHKHNNGFGAANMLCNSCHGDSSAATIDATNRYVVAPPVTTTGATGTITGIGLVSNDPKVGAHQTHLRMLNGFSNYSTVDNRCQSCHGPVPTDFVHANGTSPMVFSDTVNNKSLANKWGARTGASFSSTNLTCSNTYCHNPAGTGGTLLAANVGSKVFPSWTSARYVTDGTKTVANCSVCHKVPGVTGFEPAGTHAGMTTDAGTDCSGCHGHNGNGGSTAGRRHIDGIKWGSGNCDSCHGYDVGTWASKSERSGVPEGKGAHEKHIAYLKARYSIVLTPTSDAFGAGNSWTFVCGVCHNGSTHEMGESIPGTGRTISITPARQFGSLAAIYNGTVGQSSATKAKTCSNIDCHYKESPIWSTY